MKKPIDHMEIEGESVNSMPEPFRTTMGKAEWKSLGDFFNLSQFGVSLDILQPGARSALRHWHTKADEFVMMLEGELILITDEGESVMSPGMCVGFKAGDDNGHHLVNRSKNPAKFIVVGSRVRGDEVHYPDDDFQWALNENGKWRPARKDGTFYESQ